MEKHNRNVVARRSYDLEDGRAWYCSYRIDGLPSRRPDHRAAGLDGVQALELALKNLAAFLYSRPEAREGRLTWLDEGRGELGLPIPDVMLDWYRDEAR